tara:strand:- start:5 stop:589 length:585 start_codon:yes stop_codon:yes gene_type:complete
MKKLFTLTIMLITLSMNAQDYSHVSNPVVDVAIFKSSEANGPENALTVPDGYFVTIADETGAWYWTFPEGSQFQENIVVGKTSLPEGFKFFSFNNNDDHIIVYVHEYSSTGSTFSYTESELDNSVKLFPNPTTSEVALNSEKTYEIEVFDILGNKVMELVGNSINMEHLSNATYIVNALDVETQESLSYKVIKK